MTPHQPSNLEPEADHEPTTIEPRLTDELAEAFEGAALADGLEAALVGLGTQFSHSVAVYDLARCIEILVERDGMTPDEAREFLDFNTLGAYAGESTPIFVHVWLDDHEHER